MKETKQENAITLIALIITIIILLILSVVTINAIQGEDGLIAMAKKAKEKTIIANEKEAIELLISQWELEKCFGDTQLNFKSYITTNLGNKATSVNGESDGPLTITMSSSGNKYTITERKIEKVNNDEVDEEINDDNIEEMEEAKWAYCEYEVYNESEQGYVDGKVLLCIGGEKITLTSETMHNIQAYNVTSYDLNEGRFVIDTNSSVTVNVKDEEDAEYIGFVIGGIEEEFSNYAVYDQSDNLVTDKSAGIKVAIVDQYAMDYDIALCNDNLKKGIILDGTTTIKDAFRECINLETVEIPDSVTKIYIRAFEDCTSLKNIKIPTAVTQVQSNIFENWDETQTIDIRGCDTSTWDIEWDYKCNAKVICNDFTWSDVSNNESYVGCYADIDGDDVPDGIIFADLMDSEYASGRSWNGDSNGEYSYTVINESKAYCVSNQNYYRGYKYRYGFKPIIKIKENSNGADRFYIMSLESIGSFSFDYSNFSCDYTVESSTLTQLGTGKTNTNILMNVERLTSNGYNLWANIADYINDGWFVPSRAELCAFLDYVETNNITGVYLTFWTSSQKTESSVWYCDSSYKRISNVSLNSSIGTKFARTF